MSFADCTTRGEDEDEDIREAMRLSMVDDSERHAIIGPPIGTRVTMEELDANRSPTASDRDVMELRTSRVDSERRADSDCNADAL